MIMADIEHEHWVCRNCESVDGPTVEGDCALCREDSVQSPVVALVPADQPRGAVDLLRELSERWADVRVSGNAARVAALGDAMQRARDLTGGQ